MWIQVSVRILVSRRIFIDSTTDLNEEKSYAYHRLCCVFQFPGWILLVISWLNSRLESIRVNSNLSSVAVDLS